MIDGVNVPVSTFCSVFCPGNVSEFIHHIGPMNFSWTGVYTGDLCISVLKLKILGFGGHKHQCNGHKHQCGASEWQGLHLGSSAAQRNPRGERDHEKGQLLNLYLFYVAIFILILTF